MEIKDFTKSKSVKVNCDFCGKEIECPEDMLEKSKKHMCMGCFESKNYPNEELKDVHVDMPMSEMNDKLCSEMADRMINEVFPELWQSRKDEFKELSKKELAEEIFGAGVYLGVKAFLETLKHAEEDDEKNKTD